MYTTLISAADAAAHLGDPNWIFLDIRHDLMQPEAWGEAQYRASHVPGAPFVHLDRDLAGVKTGHNGRHPLPTPAACAALFGRLGIDGSCQVVTYDQSHGVYASRMWWMLRWLGHRAVAVLNGGFDAWCRGGHPTTGDIPVPRARTFTPAIPLPTADAAEIEAKLHSPALTLIDARSPERFRGELEPLDPVAGHIPGARNRPYVQNIDAQAVFRPAEALREEFTALLAGRDPATVVHQCGSGVSGCHNLLAMEVAGLRGSRLYPGSWSEWCADPKLPVATGSG